MADGLVLAGRKPAARELLDEAIGESLRNNKRDFMPLFGKRRASAELEEAYVGSEIGGGPSLPGHLLRSCLTADHADGALRLANAHEGEFEHDQALRELAHWLCDAHRIREAIVIARRMTSASSRAYLLIEIGERQADPEYKFAF